jgi:hypothetical protein
MTITTTNLELNRLTQRLADACDRPDQCEYAQRQLIALIDHVGAMPDPALKKVQVRITNGLYGELVHTRPFETRILRLKCDRWLELDAHDFAWLKMAVKESENSYYPYTLETRPSGTHVEPTDTRQYFGQTW